ncbi:sulfotransferase family protein [Streptosporangium sp. NPDC020145]|uniref:sulfotransferase family protein n=1 Tax=Streptosporangium sp. NPDC020145 TaxID=3154694 RepID=UPI00342D068A
MLEIIGAGFGRTGSYSLQAALTRLGYGPCHHMSSLGEDTALIRQWAAIADGDTPHWQQLLTGYRSAVDWPVAAYWRDLLDAFPTAKVILTVRDPEHWYDSAQESIYRFMAPRHGSAALVSWLENRLSPSLRRRREICRQIIWEGTFSGRFEDREHAIEVYQRHVTAVRQEVPPDRLLVFDVRQGWQPLCTFLAADTPAEPFPHLNDRASFQRMANLRTRRTLMLRRTTPGEGAAIR